MIAIDVNILIYFVVESSMTQDARRVLDFATQWFAPSFLRFEFINVLSTWNRRGIMNRLDCQKTWHRAEKMISQRLIEPDPDMVLNLTLNHQITAYDAQYIQVAIDRNVPLVTEDKELLVKFPQIAIGMTGFLNSRSGN